MTRTFYYFREGSDITGAPRECRDLSPETAHYVRSFRRQSHQSNDIVELQHLTTAVVGPDKKSKSKNGIRGRTVQYARAGRKHQTDFSVFFFIIMPFAYIRSRL